MKILITGGLGYIGSHLSAKLQKLNHEIIIIDDLSNTNLQILNNIKSITGIYPCFYKINVTELHKLDEVFFLNNNIDLVIHLSNSLTDNNPNDIFMLNNIIVSMSKFNVNNIIYTTSYENNTCEKVLKMYMGQTEMSCIILKYYDVIGHHNKLKINSLNNYMTNIINTIFGNTNDKLVCRTKNFGIYDVHDITYIDDIINGYILSIDFFKKKSIDKIEIFELGTENGYNEHDILEEFKKVTGCELEYTLLFGNYQKKKLANTKNANEKLKWKSEIKLNETINKSINCLIIS